MGRRYALGAAVGVVIAGIVWLALPAGREVRPAEAPTVENVAGSPSAPVPATVTAGGAGTTPPPAGGVTAGGVVLADAAPGGDAASGKVAGLPTRDPARAAAEARARAHGAPGDGSPAGDSPAAAKREIWQGTLALRGRLLDVAGKPIPKAKIRLNDARPWPGAPPRPIVETDAEGRFAFVDLPSNRYQLFADVGTGETNVAWYLLPGQEPIDLTYKPAVPNADPPGATRVRVVGPGGQAVPRAQVRVIAKGGSGSFLDAADGTFLRGKLDDGVTTYEVFDARTKEREPLPLGPARWTPRAGEEDVVALPAGRSLSGTVRDPEGVGVFGAEIVATHIPPRGERLGVASPHARSVTDRAGRFRLISLGEGAYHVSVVPLPPHLPSDGLDTQAGAEDVEIRLVKGRVADVIVLDEEGRPLAGAIVSGHWEGGGSSTHTGFAAPGTGPQVTDAEGRAHLSQIAPWFRSVLRVAPPTARKDLGTHVHKDWDVKDTTVRLTRLWLLKGAVRRADGSTAMSFVHRRGGDGLWSVATTTKKYGTFELPLAEAGPWVLAASAAPDGQRGPEATITDASVAVTLDAPAAAPTPTPTK
jgi:hypothetical protein